MKKSGYVSIIGKTNAGKSTLLNKLIGQKVSIVSPKKQTTRENILGILTKDNYQIIFVDTPGIHKSKNALDKAMNKEVRAASEGVDAIIYMIDITKKIDDEEINYLKKLIDKNSEIDEKTQKKSLLTPIFIVLSKIDATTMEKSYSEVQKLNQLDLVEILPISTFKNKNLDLLLNKIIEVLPEVEYFNYEEDEITDKSVKFLVSEIIREKTLYLLDEEIPHGIAVVITTFDEENGKICADIVCERESHKRIIVGHNGEMIKKIGMNARKEIEYLLDRKINLKLFVRVEKDWRAKGRLEN
ncbi:MAG: GTPase Era [Firmicutes bacterium]|nr:GTPase Era [Bacillota bacterium]